MTKVDVSGGFGEQIEELGQFEHGRDVIVVEIRRYRKEPLVNVQAWYEADGEWRPGKRPAYDYELLCKVLPLLEKAKTRLESIKDAG